jgi:DNA repair protein RadC
MNTLNTKRIREIPTEYAQLVLDGFDYATNRKVNAKRKHILNETFAKLRQLHDELNAQLYDRPTERPSITSPADAAGILQYFIGALDHEEMWVINLDTRNHVKSLTDLYKGSVNSSQVRVGEVFCQAITENSPAIIVAHNHPSGEIAPSPDDVSVTRAIVQAGKILDIDVLDHLIIAGGRYASLKERGLGFS